MAAKSGPLGTPHGVPLNTLKDCFRFLLGFCGPSGKQKLKEMAQALEEQLKISYENKVNARQIEGALSKFLEDVDKFYKKLVRQNVADDIYDIRGHTSDKLLQAFLECLPKFLAAMYYLWYDVNATFERLGGGGWKYNYPGYEREWVMYSSSGGDLQKYFRATVGNSNDYGGTLPGGFGYQELRYGDSWNGYYQGYLMEHDIKKILDIKEKQFTPDVFVTTVESDSGIERVNTANVLALVGTFCDIVERDKGAVKSALEKQLKEMNGKCLDWSALQSHCKELKESQIHKLFAKQHFDHTGQSLKSKDIKHLEFAEETAEWLRVNLGTVRSNLERINTKDPAVKTPNSRNLGAYFTNHLFPYGFVFEANHHVWNSRDPKALLQRWREVIEMLRKSQNGLDKLKKILDGGICPKLKPQPLPSSPKAAKPPVLTPAAAKPVATKTEATKPIINKAGLSSNRNTGQSDAKSTTSSAGTSPSSPSPGSAGAPGPAGPQGGKGKQGSPGTGSTKSSPTQKTVPPQQTLPPPAPPTGPPAAPAPSSQPSGGSGSQNGGDHTVKQPAGASQPAHPSSTSVPSPAPPSSSVHGSGGGKGPPAAGPQGAKGQGTQGSGSQIPQTVVPSQPAPPQSSGVQPPGSPSPGATAPSNGQGQSHVSTPGTTQHGVQGTSQSSTTAATTTSAGSGGGGGGQGQTFAATDAQTVINSPKGPQIHSFSPPEIDVIYGPQKISENLEEAYRKVLQKNMKSVPPNLSIEITKPPTSDTDNSKDAPLVVLHDPTEFGLGGAVASDEDEPVVLGVGGEPITSDSDVFKQQHIAEIQDVHQKLYEKQKAEDLELKKALEAGAKRQHQDTLWTENMDDVLRKEKETEEMRKNLQDDTLGEVVEIPFNTKICAPENIIQRAVHGFNTYPPPIIDIRAVDSKNIYSIPDGSNKLVNVPDPKQLPTLDIIRAYIPRSYDINPPNISQGEYNSAASPVLFDITKPTRPTDEDDDDKSFQHMDDVKSVLIGVNPAYEVIDDGLEISKVTHTDAEETVDLFIETLNTPPSQPLHDYDPENIPMIKIKADHTRDGLGDFSMGDADRSDINIPMAVFPDQSPDDLNTQTCQNPWYVTPSSTSPTSPPASLPPDSDHLPSPNTVRKMLYWMVGLNQYELVERIKKHVASLLEDFKNDALYVTLEPYTLTASLVSDKLTEACLYSARILYRIKHTDISDAFKDFFKDKEKYAYYYSTDPDRLLCQLRDYVYACCHQLQFLKAQCKRDKSQGGWQNCKYGSDIKTPSPLQAFLTDGWDSTFETHPFDPCNLCLKSRVRMGFKREDLPKKSEAGTTLSSILTPSCGGSDPLLTLASYLNCITRRTPRTTGELVSYFHNFGNEVHYYASESLSPLGSSLTKSHADCPDWDHLKNSDFQAVKGIRGSESLISKHNSNHSNAHPRTLSTLVGCSSDNTNCPPNCSPITYRAYALYSQSFAHTYLSWTVYLPDRLLESLQKLHYDLQKHLVSDKCTSLYSCSTALPLLYTHGITPPEGTSQVSLKCSDVITKLEEIVAGQPIATLMTAMDNFLYGIREPFIFTLVALWSLALLIFANTMLYRLDVLYIRSHLIRTKASHHIDVKALLTDGKKMMSLYDANYFDDDPAELLNLI